MKSMNSCKIKRIFALIIVFSGLSWGLKLTAVNIGASYWHSSLKESAGGLGRGDFSSASFPGLGATVSSGAYFLSTKLSLQYVSQGEDNYYGVGEGSVLFGRKINHFRIYTGVGLPFYNPSPIDTTPFIGSGNIAPFIGGGGSGKWRLYGKRFKWSLGAKLTLPLELAFTDYNLLLGSWSGYGYGKLSYKPARFLDLAVESFFSGANNLWKYQSVYVDELDLSIGVGPSVSIRLGRGHYLSVSGGLVVWNYNQQSFSNLNSSFSEEKRSGYASLGYSRYF